MTWSLEKSNEENMLEKAQTVQERNGRREEQRKGSLVPGVT